MINFQKDFGSYGQDDDNYNSYYYQNIPQRPLLRNQIDDLEFYQVYHMKNIQNIDEINDYYNSEQLPNEFSYLNYTTQEQNYSSKNKTHIIQSKQPRDDKQGEIQEDELRKNKKKQILKLNVDSILPGESKNLPKCYARQLKIFIANVCDQTEDPEIQKLKDDEDVKQFLSIKVEKLSKFELFQFINTPGGSIFCKEFFGKCLWNFGVVKESKSNVAVLYRHNLEQFYQVIKKKKE